MNLAYFNLHEITSRDAFRIGYENGRVAGYNIAHESVASAFQMARFKSSYGSIPIPNNPRIVMRQVVPLGVIADAAKQFGSVVKKPSLVKFLASFTKSISAYKVGNYETAIILAWFISESIISGMWNSHINSLNRGLPGGQQRINQKRKDYLLGRDFHMSIVTNVLELFDALPFNLFKNVDEVRRFRNDIVHKEPKYSPKAKDAQLAINTAVELSKAVYAIDFIPSLSYQVVGL